MGLLSSFARRNGTITILTLFLTTTIAHGQLLINGGFETPAEPVNLYRLITPGNEPVGFGWTVGLNSVEIQRQGYVGGGGTLPFNGASYEGLQLLDLDGFPNPGSITQTFTTTPGVQYALNFAYANNPYRVGSPAQATVSVQDAVGLTNLITPLAFSHNTSTVSNYFWNLSGPLSFTASGTSTKLSFVSNNGSGDAGIYLDAISVVAVPEPSTLVLVGMGGAAIFFYIRKQKRL
ncbi:MAG TPA: DUF642 domain-containing protein [Gemmatales bacterium]|nr:DUF642 domain-containing protein [Gemmatales bacterium]